MKDNIIAFSEFNKSTPTLLQKIYLGYLSVTCLQAHRQVLRFGGDKTHV